MCTGRVEPNHVLSALRMGADGVMVIGCHPGDCHYISGNEQAEVVTQRTKEILVTYRDTLNNIAETLMEVETLDQSTFKTLVAT